MAGFSQSSEAIRLNSHRQALGNLAKFIVEFGLKFDKQRRKLDLDTKRFNENKHKLFESNQLSFKELFSEHIVNLSIINL